MRIQFSLTYPLTYKDNFKGGSHLRHFRLGLLSSQNALDNGPQPADLVLLWVSLFLPFLLLFRSFFLILSLGMNTITGKRYSCHSNGSHYKNSFVPPAFLGYFPSPRPF